MLYLISSMLRKLILFLTPLLVITILFLTIVLIVNRDGGKGALQVTSAPESQIFLDNKYMGKTPLCLCDLPQLQNVGDYNLKLVPSKTGFKTFEQKITLYKGVLTVVDRTFDKEVSQASGSIITLAEIDEENSSQLLIISFPSRAQVILDSNIEGTTPLLIKEITSSDHEIKILKDGYKEKILKVKTIDGKRLEATVTLGIKADLMSDEKKASTGAQALIRPQVVVLDTPTGFLRVRESASPTAPQIAVVNPGEKLELVSEKSEWFEIRLSDGTVGWISSSYAKKE